MRKTRSAPASRGRSGSLLRGRGGGGGGGFVADELVAHEPERWLSEFNDYGNGTANPDMENIRAMRLFIQEQTFAVCEAGQYFTCSGDAPADATGGAAAAEGGAAAAAGVPEGVPPRATVVELQPSPQRQTALCPASAQTVAAAFAAVDAQAGGAAAAAAPAAMPFVEVRSMDCLDAARALCGAGERVAVLNMANAYTPGGGFRAGCGAQEENLHRRTDLHLFLEDRRAWMPPQTRLYPIPPDAALYSPDVRVFRGPEADGYSLLQTPFSVDIVSCAAMARPSLASATRLAPEAEAELRLKIQTLLAACRDNGATRLVLSALGCGAFCNPPDHVAMLFKEALLSPTPVDPSGTGAAGGAEAEERGGVFGDCFSQVVFSIFDDHNAKKPHNPEGNFVPFERCFSSPAAGRESGPLE